jgi:hypothetical protein
MMWRLALLALGGCSFAFVSGPPANHRTRPAFDCSTSRAVPVLDTALTGYGLASLAIAAAVSDHQWASALGSSANPPPISRHTGMIIYASLAALGAAGMYYGYTRVAACRAARADLLILQSQPTAPVPAPTPP